MKLQGCFFLCYRTRQFAKGHLIEGWQTILGIWVMEWPTEGGNGIPEYGGPTGLSLFGVAASDRSESLQVRCPSIRQQRSGNLVCRGISQRLGCVLPRPQRCTTGSSAESRLPAVCMSVRGMSHGVLLLLSQQSGRGHGSVRRFPGGMRFPANGRLGIAAMESHNRSNSGPSVKQPACNSSAPGFRICTEYGVVVVLYSVLFGAPHTLAIIVFLARQLSRIPWARTGHVAYQSQKSVNRVFLVPAGSALVKSRISEKRHPERKVGGAFQEDSTEYL